MLIALLLRLCSISALEEQEVEQTLRLTSDLLLVLSTASTSTTLSVNLNTALHNATLVFGLQLSKATFDSVGSIDSGGTV
jgi:hypothetical protein